MHLVCLALKAFMCSTPRLMHPFFLCVWCCCWSRGEVWAVTWSVTSEYQLYSGDSSGRVLCWDVRRAGPLYCLDQYRTLFSRPSTTHGHTAQGGSTTVHNQPPWNNSSSHGPTSAMARAHDAAVTSVHVTPDGAHIITTGRDGRMRLWEAGCGSHLLVHYPNTQYRSPRPLTLSSTADGRYVFAPSSNSIHVSEGPDQQGVCVCGGGFGERWCTSQCCCGEHQMISIHQC